MQSRRLFSSLRTRILGWYVVLVTASMLVSIVGIRQTLLARLYERIEQSLEQEVLELRQLKTGLDPRTSQPFGNDIDALFRVFLSRNIPANNEFMLTFLDGEFDRSSPRAVPESLDVGSPLAQSFAAIATPRRQWLTTSQGETIVYQAEPIFREGSRGVFVVVHVLSPELREVDEAIAIVMRVMLTVLALTSIVAWFFARRALAPLHLLIQTAHTIGESDLTRRIPVQGVDEISELTLRFNEMLDRLQLAFVAQRNFVSDAGHELRTPITIIRGHLELLGSDPEEQRETLDLVTDELDRMSRFVDDLLLLAKAEQPDFLRLEILDVSTLAEELFAKAKALGDRHWQLDSQAQGRIVGDRQRLTQAVMSLAQNATQHTQPGDTITLGTGLEQGTVRFWVSDTGEGIPWVDQSRVFERFARASHGQRRSEGAGLGLAIVRAIAQAHGGMVELVSRPHQGATFTLKIPVDPL
ncbi:MAG: ATP-binding protein [Cyanobacteria bacterium J069]|nr:MAG: HAMP domain-containing protein [Cyanobacteria bacterium J069]